MVLNTNIAFFYMPWTIFSWLIQGFYIALVRNVLQDKNFKNVHSMKFESIFPAKL